MVIFVEYNIPKDYFVKHKKDIKKVLNKLSFDIIRMKFEKEMSYKEIAKELNLNVWILKKIISNSLQNLRMENFKI